MIWLMMAVAVFLVTHTLPALPRLRGRLIAVLGWRLYMIAYSAVSLAVMVWVAVAYRRAPYLPLWDYDPQLFWLPIVVMPWACMAVMVGVLRPNPLSVSFYRHTESFDADRPGLLGLSRHPLLWGFLLWALVHMVVNGDAASVLMFGLLAVLSAVGMPILDAKRRHHLGGEVWARLARNAPLCLGGAGGRLSVQRRDGFAMGLGVVLYVILLVLHPVVIGVSPLPQW
jgi:uncharacterized membrane protein